jgi:hypothetical protein
VHPLKAARIVIDSLDRSLYQFLPEVIMAAFAEVQNLAQSRQSAKNINAFQRMAV